MSDAWISSGLSIAAWLATYAIHSTVLLALAWIVTRVVGDRPALTSAVWKVAVVGGLASASLSSTLAIEPLAGRAALEVSAPQATIAVVSVPMQGLAEATDTAAVADLLADEPPIEPAPAPLPPTRTVWPAWLAFAWIFGAALALGSLVGAYARLWAILRTTRPAGTEIRRAFAAIVGPLPNGRMPALLESDAVVVPFATGVLAPIIVVPACASERLSAAALRTMLAHELAHVLRRDPSWRVALVALERVLFFQPLLRLARRGVEHDAEYLCDAWAATRTAAPLELARCLTEIAGWGHSRRLALAATMAEPRSILRRRVLRLLASDAPLPTSSRTVLLLAVLACAVLPFVAPAVASAGGNAPKTIVIRTAPQHGEAPREITIITRGPADDTVPVAPLPPSTEPTRAEERARKKADRRTTRDLRRTIRRARKDDRLPTAEELADVLDAREAVAPVIARVDDTVIVVDAEALAEARAIAVELDAIIVGSAALADAARANAHRRRDERSRALERQARALRQRAAAHRDAARALRMRIVGEHATPGLAPLPPAPPSPPRPPSPPLPPDIVPAIAPLP